VEKHSCDTVSLLHIISPASDTTSTHDIVLEDIVTDYEKTGVKYSAGMSSYSSQSMQLAFWHN